MSSVRLNKYTAEELGMMSPKDFRGVLRQGEWADRNPDACQRYAQVMQIYERR